MLWQRAAHVLACAVFVLLCFLTNLASATTCDYTSTTYTTTTVLGSGCSSILLPSATVTGASVSVELSQMTGPTLSVSMSSFTATGVAPTMGGITIKGWSTAALATASAVTSISISITSGTLTNSELVIEGQFPHTSSSSSLVSLYVGSNTFTMSPLTGTSLTTISCIRFVDLGISGKWTKVTLHDNQIHVNDDPTNVPAIATVSGVSFASTAQLPLAVQQGANFTIGFSTIAVSCSGNSVAVSGIAIGAPTLSGDTGVCLVSDLAVFEVMHSSIAVTATGTTTSSTAIVQGIGLATAFVARGGGMMQSSHNVISVTSQAQNAFGWAVYGSSTAVGLPSYPVGFELRGGASFLWTQDQVTVLASTNLMSAVGVYWKPDTSLMQFRSQVSLSLVSISSQALSFALGVYLASPSVSLVTQSYVVLRSGTVAVSTTGSDNTHRGAALVVGSSSFTLADGCAIAMKGVTFTALSDSVTQSFGVVFESSTSVSLTERSLLSLSENTVTAATGSLAPTSGSAAGLLFTAATIELSDRSLMTIDSNTISVDGTKAVPIHFLVNGVSGTSQLVLQGLSQLNFVANSVTTSGSTSVTGGVVWGTGTTISIGASTSFGFSSNTFSDSSVPGAVAPSGSLTGSGSFVVGCDKYGATYFTSYDSTTFSELSTKVTQTLTSCPISCESGIHSMKSNTVALQLYGANCAEKCVTSSLFRDTAKLTTALCAPPFGHTATQSPTFSASPTQSASSTPSITPPPTPTLSASPSGSNSVTESGSTTITPPPTPTASGSSSTSRTQTASSSKTGSSSPSESSTVTPPPTPTLSSSLSASPSASTSGTSSFSRSSTVTPPPTPTRSTSLSDSTSESSSASGSGSATITPPPTPTPTNTPTPTASRSASSSMSQSDTVTPPPTPTGSSSLSDSSSGSASGSESGSTTITPPPTPTGSGSSSNSRTQTASSSKTGSSSPSESSTVTPPPTPTLSSSLSASPSASTSGTSSFSRSSSATPPPTPTLSTSLSDSRSASASASDSGSTTITPPPTPTVSGSFSDSKSRSVTKSMSRSESRSDTGTATPPPTPSGSGSATESFSVSFSDSHSMSITDSLSSSRTASRSVSVSSTGTRTPSVSKTQSTTLSRSLSTSSSLSETLSTSFSVSRTHTPPPTSSLSDSLSETVSLSLSDSHSRSPSLTETSSASNSVSKSPSSTVSRSASETGSPSQSKSATNSVTASESVSQSDSLTSSPSRSPSPSDSITDSSTPSKSTSRSLSRSTSLSVSLTQTETLPCRGRGILSQNQAGQFCRCRAPWTGIFCGVCTTPGYTERVGFDECALCFVMEPSVAYAASATSIASYNLTILVPDCVMMLQLHARFAGNALNASTLSRSAIQFQMPQVTSVNSVEFVELFESHMFVEIPFAVTKIRCLPRYVFTDPSTQIPTSGSFFVHILDAALSSRSSVLGILGGVFAQATSATTNIVVTFRGSDLVLVMNASRREEGLAELQSRLLTLSTIFTQPPSSSCSLGLNPARSPTTGDVFILSGDIETHCAVDTSWSELGTLLSVSGVRAFWVGVSPRAPPFSVAVPFSVTGDPVYEFYAAFARHLSLTAAVRCAGAVYVTPAQVPLAQRSLLSFDGVCDASVCCIGDVCSSLVSSTGQRVSCYTPLLLKAGQFVVTLVARDGRSRVTAQGYLTVVPPTAADVGAARSTHFIPSGASWASSPLPMVTVTRTRSVAAVRANNTAGATRCCRLVGLFGEKLDVVGGLESTTDPTSATTFCLNESTKSIQLPLSTYEALLPYELAAVAVQCVTPLSYASVGSTTTPPPGRGDVVWSVTPQTAPTGTAIVNGDADLQPNWGRLKRRRIDAMLQTLLRTATAQSGGVSLEHVVNAVHAAGLRTTYPSEQRTCEAGEVPQVDRSCFYKWSRYAASAGPYLQGAGFVAVRSDWYLSNALVGDVVVFPSLSVFNPDTRQLEFHPYGHIAVKFSSSNAGYDWVSDFVHTSMVYEHVYSAVDSYVAPVLYRLSDAALEWPGANEILLPVWGVQSYVASPIQWAARWATLDARLTPLEAAVGAVAQQYSCPSTDTDESRFPQQLWRQPLLEAMAPYAARCYRLAPTGSRPIGVRCCYDGSGAFVPQWPSQIEYIPNGLVQWTSAIDAETVCCLGPGKDSDACRLYQQRRPAPAATTRPLGGTQRWTSKTQWGGSFGDPHCLTYDGTPFECNFDGEARYTQCDGWSVHIVARPVGGEGGLATVITRVAVRYGADTVVIVRASDMGVEELGSPIAIYLNDQRVSVLGASTNDMTVSLDNLTVSISDSASNFVRVSVFDLSMGLVTVPGASCRNRTSGLTGNNNGDPSDDFLPIGAATPLPINSTNETIYTWFVLSQLVLDASESLFPLDLFVAGNLSFIPLFANATELAATCPSACNGDTSCCFDAAAGGAAMIGPYLAMLGELQTAREIAVSVNAPEPPVFITAPASFVITLESLLRGTTFTYVAEGTVLPPTLTCDACSNTSFSTCSSQQTAANRTTLSLRVLDVRAAVIVCTANATNNLSSVAATRMYVQESLDVVIPAVTYAPTPGGGTGDGSVPTPDGTPTPPRWNVVQSSGATIVEGCIAMHLILLLVVQGVIQFR